MDEGEFPWSAPTCHDCGLELDIEPIASGHGLRVSYSCPRHGLVSLADPFDHDDDPFTS
jgi:hypothetical protein